MTMKSGAEYNPGSGLGVPKLALYAGFIVLCLIIGPLIVVAGPRSTLLVLGGVIGIFLITQAEILLAVTTVVALVITGTVIFFGRVDVFWATYGLAAVMFGTTLLHVFFANAGIYRVRAARIKQTNNSFPLLLTAFLIYSIFLSALNGVGAIEFVAAAKQYFMMGGVWAVLAFYGFRAEFIRAWLKGLVAIALIQLPFALYQYIFVRSFRISAGLGRAEASDSVVGTFGGSFVSGGNTAALAAFLVMTVTILWAFHRDGLVSRNKFISLAVLCGAPLLIMEVKAIFIFLPLCLFVLFRDYVKGRPVQFIGGLAVVTVALGGLLFAYQLFHWSANNKDLESNVERTFLYSFATLDKAAEPGELPELSRFSALQFWWNENIEKADSFGDFLHTTFGHGLGSSHVGRVAVGAMAAKHFPLEIDYTGFTALLWDMGIVGLFWYFYLVFHAYVVAGRLQSEPSLEDWQRSLARGLQAVVPVLLLFAGYRSDIPHGSHMMFMLFAHLGLLCWLCSQQKVTRPK